MKLVLHPGFPKCGSSSIQHFLYQNWRLLLENGYALPDQNFSSPFSNAYQTESPGPPNRVFREIKEGAAPDNFLERLDEQLELGEREGLRGIVVSSENLINNADGYRLILAAFGERFADVDVIIYARRQDDFFLSSWQQWAFHQGQQFDVFVEQRLSSMYPNYYADSAALESSLGKGSATLALLHTAALKNGSLLQDFVAKLGIGAEWNFQDAPMVNQSINPYLCEALARKGNLVANRFSNDWKRGLIERFGNDPRLFAKCPEFVDLDTRRLILKAFEPSNKLLQAKYFPQIDFDLVFGVENDMCEKAAADGLQSMKEWAERLASEDFS